MTHIRNEHYNNDDRTAKPVHSGAAVFKTRLTALQERGVWGNIIPNKLTEISNWTQNGLAKSPATGTLWTPGFHFCAAYRAFSPSSLEGFWSRWSRIPETQLTPYLASFLV